ncbi:ATP-binding cassette domain-containing protein [Actinotalea solisilvae]|uniref:ATP-binding cassette domain-containing protein n=1 Tax=Actinotalea solisilvae TaxID=2072922 RepID=UPI0018F1F7D5|nr:ATP-binding cassette domain-containing protein [Actinotalea solisilvae]
MTTMVDIAGLEKAYGPTRVLAGMDLQVQRGSVVALLGPNGAGKTTTVHVLATLLRPDAGTVRVDGLDVTRDAAAVRHRIGLTGQYAALDPLLTGAENLRLMGRVAHLDPRAARRRCAELLELFDLVDARDRLVRTYSGGMRRRLDLAAGLLGRPALMVLDEPTTGLDPRSRNDLWQVIRDVVADGTTVLLTTQYLDEADQLADRVAVLDHGRVIAEGTAAALKRQVGEAHVELTLADGGRERVRTDGSVADVRRILADVEERLLAVEHWEVRAPTLDDVFLTLTGAPAPADRTLQEAS